MVHTVWVQVPSSAPGILQPTVLSVGFFVVCCDSWLTAHRLPLARNGVKHLSGPATMCYSFSRIVGATRRAKLEPGQSRKAAAIRVIVRVPLLTGSAFFVPFRLARPPCLSVWRRCPRERRIRKGGRLRWPAPFALPYPLCPLYVPSVRPLYALRAVWRRGSELR